MKDKYDRLCFIIHTKCNSLFCVFQPKKGCKLTSNKIIIVSDLRIALHFSQLECFPS